MQPSDQVLDEHDFQPFLFIDEKLFSFPKQQVTILCKSTQMSCSVFHSSSSLPLSDSLPGKDENET